MTKSVKSHRTWRGCDYIAQSIDALLLSYPQLEDKVALEDIKSKIRTTKAEANDMVGALISNRLSGDLLRGKIASFVQSAVQEIDRYSSLTRLFIEFEVNFNLFMDESQIQYQIDTSRKEGPLFASRT